MIFILVLLVFIISEALVMLQALTTNQIKEEHSEQTHLQPILTQIFYLLLNVLHIRLLLFSSYASGGRVIFILSLSFD